MSPVSIERGAECPYVYKPDANVLYLAREPRSRKAVEQTNIYSVIRQMPIEADGRIRYRIKNRVDKTERVVTEEELSIVPLLQAET